MPPPPDVPSATTVPGALAQRLRGDAGSPLVTYYDDASGERVELSATTFDNWVSKIANLVTLELMLEPGGRMAVELPIHWQSTVSAVGGWVAGLALVTGPDELVDLRVVSPEGVQRRALDPHADHVLACSLRPFAARFVEPLPPQWLDFALEVPPQPDALVVGGQVEASTTAVISGQQVLTHGDLVEQALGAAERIGLARGGRLLTDLNPAEPEGLLAALVAPLLVRASVVLISPTSPGRRTTIARQERATVTAWAD